MPRAPAEVEMLRQAGLRLRAVREALTLDQPRMAAELGAAVGGPVPEWPNAVNSQGVARAPGHRPRRPAGRTIHEDNA